MLTPGLGAVMALALEALPLRCSQCDRYVLSDKFSKKILKGDSFYVFKCSDCSEEESFQRLPMSWANLVQLVLYHLWEGGDRRHRYFRWREDICNTIEERWDDLIPSKQKSPSWSNSVSSVLSANEKIFASGVAIKGVPGWWSLHHWEAPHPRNGGSTNSENTALIGKRSYENFKEGEEDELLISSSSSSSSSSSEDEKCATVNEEQEDGKDRENDIIIDTEEDEIVEQLSELAQNNLNSESAAQFIQPPVTSTIVPPINNDKKVAVEKAAVVVPSEGLKKQLLERLLMMDSSLLHEAIKKAKAKKLAEVYSLNNSNNNNNNNNNDTANTANTKNIADKSSNTSMDIAKDGRKIVDRVKPGLPGSNVKAPSSLVSDVPSNTANVVINTYPRMFDSELNAFKLKYPPDAQVIRASPYENDLLKKCNRVLEDPLPGGIARLRRKLLMRRQKRKVGIPLFDLDTQLYLYLKTTEIPLKEIIDLVTETETKAESTTPVTEVDIITSKNINESDQNDETFQEPDEDSNIKSNIDLQAIPYILDPKKSLFVKLTGMAAIYGCCPYPITSPFTGKILPAFIERENCVKIPKLNLMNELRKFYSVIKCGEFKEVNSEKEFESEVDFSGIVLPSTIKSTNMNIDNSDKNYEPLTLDYTNLRKEFVGQINDFLSESFWPGIDVSDALEYPDYTIIALIGLSVVACAFVTPDGYLSYLHVRPDFQSHGLATKILYKLLKLTSAHMDITLHVSVTNEAAILLYQKFGFKPEEFVVNFYDKYYPAEYTENSRNAFLMRLRR